MAKKNAMPLLWSKFYWNDWDADPALRLCSMDAQGFWMRLLCIAFKSSGYVLIGGKPPSVEQLAMIYGQPVERVRAWLDELLSNQVASRRGAMIFSRRMVREARAREIGRVNGRRGGNPSLRKSTANGWGVNPYAEAEAEVEADAEAEREFAQLWSISLKQTSRLSALEAFREARRNGVSFETIHDAWKLYCEHHQEADLEHVAALATWLRGERWTDVLPPRPKVRREGDKWRVEHGSPEFDAWRRHYKADNSQLGYDFVDRPGVSVLVPSRYPPQRR